ncbi:Cilia- and flagella-associated protein [Schistosoma japonicum]|nr:Cilia- and flagella-associated protein [Schistosoma japonicum]
MLSCLNMVDISERLVEDYKCMPPPNHLLNTETFWKIGCNKFIAVEPAEINFDNLNFGSRKSNMVKQFELKNISSRVTRLHILPPDTKYFRLSYKQPKCLVPGYSIVCRLKFLPDKPEYYEDCIRVHTEDHENQLIIPIYAYPVIGDFDFPDFIEFPPTNIGEKRTHYVPINSSSVVDFEFQIQIIHMDTSFSIQPLNGILNAGQIMKLQIDFQPTNYQTCELKFELHIAQVNFKAKCCTVIGNAMPSLENSTLLCYNETKRHLEKPNTNKGEINQLDGNRKLGANPLTSEECIKILDSRELAWRRYYAKCTHPEVVDNFNNQLSSSSSINLLSNRINQLLTEFRPYRPVESTANYSTTSFKQRLMKRLKQLKQITSLLIDKKNTVTTGTINRKYADNIEKSIPSVKIIHCGTKLLHHQIWLKHSLLNNQHLTKINTPSILNNQQNQSINLLPITCTFDYNQLWHSFITPKHYWPLFNMPTIPEQYEIRYTDRFDLCIAMDYAKLIPMDINYNELLSIHQQQQHQQQQQQQQKPQKTLSSSSQINPSSLSFDNESLNDQNLQSTTMYTTNSRSVIRLPESINSLPKLTMNTISYLNNQYLPLTLMNRSTLDDHSQSLIDSINKLCNPSMNNNNHNNTSSSLSNSDYIDTILMSLDQIKDHDILKQWSSSSDMHQPLVPLTKNDTAVSHENEFIHNYELQSDEMNSIKELVEQDIQEWIIRFPQLKSIFSIQNENNDRTVNEELNSTVNNNTIPSFLNLNDTPIDEAKKYQNEILSACKFKF